MSWEGYIPPTNLFIFKTNVETSQQISSIEQVFINHQAIADWWIDIEDIDSVLRVEIRNELVEKDIILIVKRLGFDCEVLDY